jgi:hypothetical protein
MRKTSSAPLFLRMVGFLAICVAVAAVGLFTGGAHRDAIALKDPMRGYYPRQMPRYPDVNEVPAGSSRIGGGPMKMSYFTTKHDPLKIGGYYAGAWRRLGLWVHSDITHRGGVVAAMDARKGRLLQVMMQVRGEHTLVFPSVSRLATGSIKRGKAPPVALFRKSKVLLNSETTSGKRVARVHLSTNQGSLSANRTHYRTAMLAKGFKEERRAEANAALRRGKIKGDVMVFRSSTGAEVTIILTPLSKKKTRVHLTTIGL